MAKKEIQIDISEVMDSFKKIDRKFSANNYSAITVLLDTAAKKMASWAKMNRRWTDRTSRARTGMVGYAYWESKSVVAAVVAHTVDYGVYLELAHQRKYAILEQALEEHKEEIQEAVKEVLKGRIGK